MGPTFVKNNGQSGARSGDHTHCLGAAAAGRNIDVWVTNEVLQFYDGDHLLRTSAKTTTGSVRVKRAQVPGGARKVKTSVTDLPK